MPSTLVIVGASGAGRRVADIALDARDHGSAHFDLIQVLDDDPSAQNLKKLTALGLTYSGTIVKWLDRASPTRFVVGLGDTHVRRKISEMFASHGHTAATLIAPTAHISRTAVIGRGSVVSPGADLSANAQLGEYVHVMANAAISHDVQLGSHCNVNPGAVVAGSVTIGEHVTIGAGATVLQGLHIGTGALVGAGAVVTHSVPPGAVVKGVPAR